MGELATLRRWGQQRAVWAIVVVAAALVVIQLTMEVAKSSADEVETVVALAAAGWLATRRPVVSLGVILTLVIFGWNPVIFQTGGLDLRVLDVPILILAVQVLLDRSRPAALREGSKYLVALLGLTGLATLYVAAAASENFSEAAVSWLRLVATIALFWLASSAVKSRRDFAWILRVLIAAGMLATAYAAYNYVGAGVDARAAAFGGPNLFGLFAGVLVLAGLHTSVLPTRSSRVAVVLTGVVGLVLARSIASISATAIALIVGGLGTWSAQRARAPGKRDAAVRTFSRIIVGLVIVYTVFSAVRPVDLPGSEGFGYSSTAIRLSVGYAGLEIWAAHPFVGVGWQQSSTEGVINAPSVVEAVQKRFGENFRTYVEGGTGVTSVHNMYIQFLAETGIIGFAVFVWLLLGLARVVRRWVRDVAGDPFWGRNARFLSLALLLEIVWWNDNPLYGGQPESLFAPIILGLLAAATRISAAEREPADDGDAPADAATLGLNVARRRTQRASVQGRRRPPGYPVPS